MKAETVLDSVVFQLTPTRTRYDLVIIANGRTEKITSGLLDSFLTHLKTAKDQIAKGGYSIRLEPKPRTDTSWFTKDTVERFVRYVSTPEVLERVNMLESEILQLNEAIAIQGHHNYCSRTMDGHQSRLEGCSRGGKFDCSRDEEKLMVLSKHGKFRRLSTGSITQEENSRCQLLTVLENRRTVLKKEQGMAFARSVAAGFDVDHMENLILFAKAFGASRLLEACLRFVELWKANHKNGQWLEIVGGEAIPFQSESSKTFGGMFSGDDWKQKQTKESWITSSDTMAIKSNNTDNNNSALKLSSRQLSLDHIEDARPTSSDPLAPLEPQNYLHHIQNSMFPQWASHNPPVSQSYPIQGTPHYQCHPVSASSPSVDDPEFGINMNLNRHLVDCKRSKVESRIWHMNVSYQNGMDFKETNCQSQNESEEEVHDLLCDAVERKHRNSLRSVNKAQVVGQEVDGGNWQTFQKLLMRIQNENPTSRKTSDPMAENSSNLQKGSLDKVTDESFVVPLRSNLHEEQIKDKRTVFDKNSDASKDYIGRKKKQQSYEAHELSIMPERGFEKRSIDFDPAKVFDVPVQNGIKEYDESKGDQGGLKRGLRNERKLSGSQNGLEKRKMNLMTLKGKSSKVNPLADAKARAEKLRAFKADLQKARKEKEEEERRRLEALKRERQKRIAARTSSDAIQQPLHILQPKVKKPTRLSPTSRSVSKFNEAPPTTRLSVSPTSHSVSKFNDAPPTSFSPPHKSPRRSTDNIHSPWKPQQIGASMTMTTKSSPGSYRGSRFSDASPSSASPLIKLLRSSKSVSQSTHNLQDTPMLKPKRLYSSSSPKEQSPNSSKNVTQPISRIYLDSSSPRQKLSTRSTLPKRLYSSSSPIKKSSNSTKNITRSTSLYPDSSSPLQKLTTGSTQPSFSGSHTKPHGVNGGANSVRVGLAIKEDVILAHTRTRRVPYPQGSNMHRASSAGSLNIKESRVKSNSPTASENIIKVSREPSEKVNKSADRMKVKKAGEVSSKLGNNVDEPIVEKSILILENRMITDSAIENSEGMVEIGVKSCEEGRRERTESVSEIVPHFSPTLSLILGEVDDSVKDKKLSSHKAVNPPKNDPHKFSTKIPDEVPTVRPLHMDESPASSTTHAEHINQKVSAIDTKRIMARSCSTGSALLEIHEIHGKPHIKGSPKGIKELLKFRRKGQSATSSELNATSSNNGPTLQQLMSKDSHSTNSTPSKGYRPFSLFSHCQAKTSGKT